MELFNAVQASLEVTEETTPENKALLAEQCCPQSMNGAACNVPSMRTWYVPVLGFVFQPFSGPTGRRVYTFLATASYHPEL